MKNRNYSFVMSILSALFAALICVGAYIAVPTPVTPVPIVLQNFFIMLAGLILGPVWGLASILLYLLLGLLGLPVFSGGGKGIAHFMGPTGGYLISYIFAVVIIGVLTIGNKPGLLRCLFALLVSSCIVFLIGAAWLKFRLDTTWTKALVVGVYPFIPGDLIKIIAAGVIGWKLKPVVRSMIA